MKIPSLIGCVGVIGVSLILSGCGGKKTETKTEPAATVPTVEAAKAAPGSMEAGVSQAASEAVADSAKKAASMLADLKVPDLKSTSVAQLASVGTETLTNISALAGDTQPEVAKQVEAVKTSISANKATEALGQLKQLAASAQAIPGAPQAVEAAKQMVSAWALKQGFDTAKIAPVLGALQSGDYAGLASQAASLVKDGGLTDHQKELLNSVLGTFGLDAKADELVGKVKGLLN